MKTKSRARPRNTQPDRADSKADTKRSERSRAETSKQGRVGTIRQRRAETSKQSRAETSKQSRAWPWPSPIIVPGPLLIFLVQFFVGGLGLGGVGFGGFDDFVESLFHFSESLCSVF